MSCGADSTANTVLQNLLQGRTVTIPDIVIDGADFDQPPSSGTLFESISKLDINNLTTGETTGNGVFDVIMKSLAAHLSKEFQANRISGAEYTKAYIAMSAQALQTAVQFLLGKDQSYWAAIIAQQQAQKAEIEKVMAKVTLATTKLAFYTAKYQTFTAEADYGLSKLKIATEDATYCNLLVQKDVLQGQVDANIEQIKLIKEQTESARAQTTNTRSDGTVVTGMLGKQRDLYTQQIDSFKRDSEVKAAKLFTDAWITQKTIDEGLLAPSNFSNASLDTILGNIKTNNNIGPA